MIIRSCFVFLDATAVLEIWTKITAPATSLVFFITGQETEKFISACRIDYILFLVSLNCVFQMLRTILRAKIFFIAKSVTIHFHHTSDISIWWNKRRRPLRVS